MAFIKNTKIDGQLITKLISAFVDCFNFHQKKILHLQVTEFLAYEKFKLLDLTYEGDGKQKLTVAVDPKTKAIKKIVSAGKTKAVEYKKLSLVESKGNFKDFMSDFLSSKETYDFIFADLPFGIRQMEEKETALSVLNHISPGGIGVFLMPGFHRTFKGIKGQSFVQSLNDKGLKVLGVFKMPEGFLQSFTNMECNLVFISQANEIKETYFARSEGQEFADFQSFLMTLGMFQLFNAELRQEMQEHETEEDLIMLEQQSNLFDGIEARIDDFNGFEHWEQLKEITNLDSEYGNYQLIELSELAKIKSTKDSFEDINSSVYIPAIGKTDVLDELPSADSKKKSQNYYQVSITDPILKKEYLSIYLNSELGQEYLKLEFTKYTGVTIARLRVSDIKKLLIPVPNLALQEEIIENIRKLNKVKNLLSEIENNLAIKPISSSEQLDKLNQIYESSMDLSDSEKVFGEIQKGESTQREFKQTFAMCIKSKNREEYIVHECIKTVAGFLNGKGGTLYIGVADNGEITGVEVEVGKKQIFKNIDKYQLAIKDTLKKRLSASSLSNVNFLPISIRGKIILCLECPKSDHQVYVDNKDTYLRMGPSTNLLEGPDLVKFSKDRFK
jgi:hypothetical protein